MKKLMRLGALALFMSFASCGGDDNEPTNNNNNNNLGTISAVVNGEDWTGTVKSATLIKVSQMGQQRFDIAAEADGQMILLSCTSEITAGMPLETYSFNFEEGGDALFMNTYLVGNNTYTVHMPETGELTFTSFNTTTKQASGTFNFTATKAGDINGMEVPEIYTVNDGIFTNVKYSQYEQ
jgi:hypothetical protein